MPGPAQTLRLARRAARRAFVRDLVHVSGAALAIGATVSLALVAGDRIAGGFADWRLLAAAPLVAAELIAVTLCILRRPRPIAAVGEVDRALGLKDTLSSAVAFAESSHAQSPAFIEAALEDAERTAPTVRLARAMPIRAGWQWSAWPAAAALAVALGIWAPFADWSGHSRRAAHDDTRRREVAADVARAAENAAKIVEPSVADLATPEDLRTLDQLHQELVKGTSDPEQARTRAAATLDNLAGKLDAESERSRLETDKVRERLAAAPKPGPGAAGGESRDSGDADSGQSDVGALAEAMRKADAKAAADAAEKLAEQTKSMSPEERREVAEELEQLARSLDQSAAPNPSSEGAPSASERPPGSPSAPSDASARTPEPKPLDPASAPPRDTPASRELESQGILPDQARELAKKDDPKEVARELQNRGVPPDTAERLAERVADENRNRSAEESAKKRVDDLREALRDAAKDLKNEKQPEQGDAQKQDQKKDGADASKPGEPRKQPGDQGKPGQTPQAAKGGQAKPSNDSNGAPRESREGEKPDASHSGNKPGDRGQNPKADGTNPKQPSDTPAAKPDPNKPGDQPGSPDKSDAKQGDKQGDQPSDKQQDKPGDTNGDRKSGDKQGGDQKPTDKPGSEPTPTGEKVPTPGGTPAPQPGAPKPGPGDKPQQGAPAPGGQTTGPRDGSKDGPAPTGGPKPDPKNPSGQTAPTKDPTGAPGEGDTPRGQQGDKPTEEPGGAKPGAAPAPKPSPGGGPGSQPMVDPARPGAHSGAAPGDDSADPGADGPDSGGKGAGRGIDKLHEQLKEWQKRSSQGGDDQKRARELRDEAQRLLDNMSPEERDRARKWAEQMAREMGRPDGPGTRGPGQSPPPPDRTATAPVDARRDAAPGEKPDERVVARWLSNQAPERGAPVSREEMAGAIREAAAGAERAIEQQEVPRRYSDLVRRVFKRYTEQAAPLPPK